MDEFGVCPRICEGQTLHCSGTLTRERVQILLRDGSGGSNKSGSGSASSTASNGNFIDNRRLSLHSF